MSIIDSIFSQFNRHPDVANMAAKLGIKTGQAEKAIAALAVAHQEERDTIAGAVARTGLDAGIIGQIVQQIGGEGALAQFAQTLKDHPQASSLLGLLDRDGDGDTLDDVADMAKGLFGKS